MNFCKEFRVKPGRSVHFSKWDPADTRGLEKEEAAALIQPDPDLLFNLQHRLYAENKRALLIIFQGMDASGKDGVVRHVIRWFNPQGCNVTPFKAPSLEELDHDFLWRIHKAAPAKGDIGVFNRSHYEDVLVVRVNKIISEKTCHDRYKQINHFERLLAKNGMTILKFFLHISKREQRKRLIERLKDPEKNWKFNEGDLAERSRWELYANAYEDALTECSTDHAPWFVVPADKKWFRDLVVSKVIRETLEKMNLKFPRPAIDVKRLIRALS